jgi:hypothetical protein
MRNQDDGWVGIGVALYEEEYCRISCIAELHIPRTDGSKHLGHHCRYSTDENLA